MPCCCSAGLDRLVLGQHEASHELSGHIRWSSGHGLAIRHSAHPFGHGKDSKLRCGFPEELPVRPHSSRAWGGLYGWHRQETIRGIRVLRLPPTKLVPCDVGTRRASCPESRSDFEQRSFRSQRLTNAGRSFVHPAFQGSRRRLAGRRGDSPHISFLHQSLIQHRVGYFHEARDVGAIYKISRRAVFLGGFVAVAVDGDHDFV